MSEPWCPEPISEMPPGPAAQLYTLTFQNPEGLLRRVVVFGRHAGEARAQVGRERQPDEILISVDEGGTLPPIRR